MGMIYNQEKLHRETGYEEEQLRDVMDGLIKVYIYLCWKTLSL